MKIPTEIAKQVYGITCSHEKMENGEIRFRLRSDDGSAYIKTVGADTGGWQNSHFHKSVRETYVVQAGWMALARLVDGKLNITIYRPGDVVTIEPFVIHNVYLPARGVIHTVKHGISEGKDWTAYEGFDQMTKNLSENDITRLAEKSTSKGEEIDPRFNSYVTVYNNLDSLLWRVPSLFIGSAAILIGFIANIVSKPNASLSPELWAMMFFLVGILFLLGTYSMARIRFHHTIMGEELRSLEPKGYFHVRGEIVRKLWPPSAPHVFMVVFALLGIALLVLGIVTITNFELIKPFLIWEIKP